jgi:aminopeptidase N
MEYPTLVTSDRPMGAPLLDAGIYLPEIVTVHEIAHQWFPMQVQSDEAAEPWLDEAFADYLTTRVLEERYGRPSSLADTPVARMGYRALHRASYLADAGDAIVGLPSWEYGRGDYGSDVYSKGSLALRTVQGHLGEERMLRAMRLYVERWRWGHPTGPDFTDAVEDASGEELDWLVQSLIYRADRLEYALESVDTRPADGGYLSQAVVRRAGLAVPVDVAFRFADGQVQVQRWDARDERATLEVRGPSPLVSAVVDPERELALELNPLDNALSVSSAPEALGAAARWLGLLQWTLRLIGFLR